MSNIYLNVVPMYNKDVIGGIELKKYALSVLIILLLFGCSSKFNEAKNTADELFNDGDFNAALEHYKLAFQEKQDEEIKQRIIHLQLYSEIKKSMKAKEWEKATQHMEEVNKLVIDEPLRKAMYEQVDTVLEMTAKQEELKEELNTIAGWIEKESLDEAKQQLDVLKNDDDAAFLEKELQELEKKWQQVSTNVEKREQVAKAKRIKEEEERMAEAEERKKASQKNHYLALFDAFEEEAQREISIVASNGNNPQAAYVQTVVEMADQWDVYLNEVYQIIKSKMSEAEFAKLKEEQIAWVKQKEDKLSDDAFSMEVSGTAGKEPQAWVYYEETRDRCYYLVQYFME